MKDEVERFERMKQSYLEDFGSEPQFCPSDCEDCERLRLSKARAEVEMPEPEQQILMDKDLEEAYERVNA